MCSGVVALFLLFGKVVAALSERLDMPVSTFLLVFGILCGSCVLFTGPTNHFFLVKLLLKMGLTVLFTHLKIIWLQYFQFSIISGIQIEPN